MTVTVRGNGKEIMENRGKKQVEKFRGEWEGKGEKVRENWGRFRGKICWAN